MRHHRPCPQEAHSLDPGNKPLHSGVVVSDIGEPRRKWQVDAQFELMENR